MGELQTEQRFPFPIGLPYLSFLVINCFYTAIELDLRGVRNVVSRKDAPLRTLKERRTSPAECYFLG